MSMAAADLNRSRDDDRAGVARLAVSAQAAVTRRRAAAVLGTERSAWAGTMLDGTLHAGMRDRHLLDLVLRVTEHAPRVVFRKAAYVDLGPLRGGGRGPLSVGISWRAVGLAPLFPVFAGTLRWENDELRLVGAYAPPGGEIGLVADRLVLNVAARGTARWLLGRIAAVMRGDPAEVDAPTLTRRA